MRGSLVVLVPIAEHKSYALDSLLEAITRLTLPHDHCFLFHVNRSSASFAEDLRLRLSNLAERDWGPLDPLYSYAGLPGSLPHQRQEVENDLIGAFYAEGGRLPILQFEKR